MTNPKTKTTRGTLPVAVNMGGSVQPVDVRTSLNEAARQSRQAANMGPGPKGNR